MKKKEIKKAAKKTVKKIKKEMESFKLEDVLTEEQMVTYKEASEPRKKWLEVFVRTGEGHVATREAYPNCSEASMRQMTYVMRNYFKISVSDLFRVMGIDELKLIDKTNQLLDAKRIVKRFKKGDMIEEVEEEDNFAISKGLETGIKMLKIDPGQKLLHGEDRENPFQSVADLMRNLNSQ